MQKYSGKMCLLYFPNAFFTKISLEFRCLPVMWCSVVTGTSSGLPFYIQLLFIFNTRKLSANIKDLVASTLVEQTREYSELEHLAVLHLDTRLNMWKLVIDKSAQTNEHQQIFCDFVKILMHLLKHECQSTVNWKGTSSYCMRQLAVWLVFSSLFINLRMYRPK